MFAADEFQADQPAMPVEMNADIRPDDISIDFGQLSISERSIVAPGLSNPVAAPAPVHAIIVPWVREPALVHSAAEGSGAANHTEDPPLRDLLQVINYI